MKKMTEGTKEMREGFYKKKYTAKRLRYFAAMLVFLLLFSVSSAAVPSSTDVSVLIDRETLAQAIAILRQSGGTPTEEQRASLYAMGLTDADIADIAEMLTDSDTAPSDKTENSIFRFFSAHFFAGIFIIVLLFFTGLSVIFVLFARKRRIA